MNNVKNYSIKAIANVMVWTLLTLPGQVFAAPLGEDIESVDIDAERVSQFISEADVKRESEKHADNAQFTKQQNNEPKHSVRENRRILLKRSAGWHSASSQYLKVAIPDTANGSIWLSRTNSAYGAKSFIVSLPSNAGNYDNAKVAADGSIVYTHLQQDTDVAVQSFDDSTRILTVLNGTDSPSEYNYHINIPTGGKIIKDDNGGILVLDNRGSLIGGFATPWAVDRDGNPVPTHYEVRENTVVQVVEHLANSNIHYPVVADPWLYLDLISSATWVKNKQGYTLAVSPTLWARSLMGVAISYSVGVAGWNELYSKYKNKGLNTNLVGMRDQYICHQQAVVTMFKSTWNLDEWRPNVGYWATVKALCNP